MPRIAVLSRKLLLGAVLAGVSPFALAQAASLSATSRIEGVTLYPDAALVSRRVSVEIPAGEHEVVLSDLPAQIDPASLRIEGAGDTKLLIGGVEFRASAAGAGTPEAQKRLKALRAEKDRVGDKIDAAEGKKAMINRLASPGEGKDTKMVDPEQWLKAVEIVGKGLRAVNEELRVLRDEDARLDAEIAAIENPEGIAPSQPETRIVAAIAVEAQSAAKAELSVSYRVRGASWRPVYDARLDTRGTAPALELVRRALIRQQTGEDWKEAKVTLSTLAVNRGTAAPELRGEKVAIYERPAPKPVMAPAPVARSAPMSAEIAAAKIAEEQRQKAYIAADEAEAKVDLGDYQAEFVLPGKMTLASGGAERSVRLSAEKPEIKLVVRTAPVLDPTAYLEAGFTHKGETPILPGEVLLSRDGTYIGKGRFSQIAPGENTRLGFGADDRVKVTRVPLSRQAAGPGLLGSTKSEEFQFRTVVRNLHAFPVPMVIEDRIPVSEDQAITVERMSELTKPDLEAPDERRGVIVWIPNLKPQEERAFVTAYRLRWPAGKEIRALPLRP
ncbi:MAG: mucoidy inhibitor MuiA family protein [Proteobacteria bacterium]|nr:mucoidy inhibitor MuiA family protein [Pseudomonadota bacterium]